MGDLNLFDILPTQVDRVPEREKNLIRLMCEDGLAAPMIGQKLGMRPGTVKEVLALTGQRRSSLAEVAESQTNTASYRMRVAGLSGERYTISDWASVLACAPQTVYAALKRDPDLREFVQDKPQPQHPSELPEERRGTIAGRLWEAALSHGPKTVAQWAEFLNCSRQSIHSAVTRNDHLSAYVLKGVYTKYDREFIVDTLEGIEESHDVEDLLDYFQCSYNTLYKIAKDAGLERKLRPRKRGPTKADNSSLFAAIQASYEADPKKTIESLMDEFGVKRHKVQQALKGKVPRGRPASRAPMKAIYEAHKANPKRTRASLAAEFGVSDTTVRRVFEKYGRAVPWDRAWSNNGKEKNLALYENRIAHFKAEPGKTGMEYAEDFGVTAEAMRQFLQKYPEIVEEYEVYPTEFDRNLVKVEEFRDQVPSPMARDVADALNVTLDTAKKLAKAKGIPLRKRKWTKESCLHVVRECRATGLGDWQGKHSNSYNAAVRHGFQRDVADELGWVTGVWIDDDDAILSVVYFYEYENRIYIGETRNPEMRHYHHSIGHNSVVIQYMPVGEPRYLDRLVQYSGQRAPYQMTRTMARKWEKRLVREAVRKGMEVINRTYNPQWDGEKYSWE